MLPLPAASSAATTRAVPMPRRCHAGATLIGPSASTSSSPTHAVLQLHVPDDLPVFLATKGERPGILAHRHRDVGFSGRPKAARSTAIEADRPLDVRAGSSRCAAELNRAAARGARAARRPTPGAIEGSADDHQLAAMRSPTRTATGVSAVIEVHRRADHLAPIARIDQTGALAIVRARA